MREVFELDAAQLELLLGICTFIFEQAAYATTPPDKLRDELMAAGLEEEHANAFGAVWQNGAADCVAALKERSTSIAPLQLASVDWQLCVGSAGSGGYRGQAPHTVLQLDLEAPSPALGEATSAEQVRA